jgi:mannose/fructose-specific phosphotransferase system component IIA
MVRGIFLTHGALGRELVSTAEKIVGAQGDYAILSNEGLGPESLRSALERELPGDGHAVVFVDLIGGSCHAVCAPDAVPRDRFAVLSGVNLPMVVEFFYHRDRVPFDELRQRLLAKGRAGVEAL